MLGICDVEFRLQLRFRDLSVIAARHDSRVSLGTHLLSIHQLLPLDSKSLIPLRHELQHHLPVAALDWLPARYRLHQFPLPGELQDEHVVRHGPKLLRKRARLQLDTDIKRRGWVLCCGHRLCLPLVSEA